MLAAADRCEREGTREAASEARRADADADAARFAGSPEYYLRLSAKLALDVLIELKSPGVAFLSL